ncbi:MAG: zinc ribbon domain-containing protein [Betaproteobacteria bacterium]|nr:zinc ribbon domain-containing protein [Betaproteobacteria bacterium]
MPIYEYRCSNCGHQQEFLQKVSAAPHTRCTKCGQDTFLKMVTAAGFQLKGSGWYATDFKSGGSKPSTKSEGGQSEGGKSESGKSEGSSETKDGAKGAAPACGTGACPACQ